MSYPPDLLPEDRDYTEDRVAARVKGTVIALLVSAVVVYGLILGGRQAGDWVSGLERFGAEEEVVEVQPGRTVRLEIPVGSTARGIAGILVDNGVIRSASAFESVVRSRDAGSLLKAGRYELVTGTELEEIVDILVAGPTIETFRLTIVEGRRVGEVVADIARQSEFSETELVDTLLEGDIRSAYLPGDVEGLPAWEGLLFPATYEFFTDATAEEILQRLADETERRIDRLDWTSVRLRGYSVYEGLVIASIVEAEAGIDEDRPLIASVIYNRLGESYPLEIDATVLYAMGERGIGLTFDDLEFDSPYNTYRVAGLPPTPIGTPGSRSLEAAADPADSEYWYYVLVSEEGAHGFFPQSDYDGFLEAKRQAQEQGIGV
ncbi:MAG: endolytic transglycosylase MltG [bacterium]|nr:endolytic transglycosylase MltG [bacterium]MDE0288382.1 endolytic transglycosylase MltG [bacterium]MDE0438710.1 endolytic transglycosylase MltG [bacterium]